jgi:hypothetical protein
MPRGRAGAARDRTAPPIWPVLEADARIERVEVRRWNWDQTYSAASRRELMLSYSRRR